jgi:hypothetical protein
LFDSQGRKGIWLERHSSECASRREIEKIYGRYKMFALASS